MGGLRGSLTLPAGDAPIDDASVLDDLDALLGRVERLVGAELAPGASVAGPSGARPGL